MYLINKEQYLAIACDDLLHHSLQSLLELSLILRTSNQCSHIERKDELRLQILGHIAIHNTVGDTLGNSGLTHTRLTDENWVVLGTARKNLQHTTYLVIASNHWVELTTTRLLIEVYGVLAKSIKLLRRGLRIDR